MSAFRKRALSTRQQVDLLIRRGMRVANRQANVDACGLDERMLVWFVHHLTIVRNHCAHHGRIWNRRFTLKMQAPAKKPSLTMLAFLMHRVSPASAWPQRVMGLISGAPEISTGAMGFPMDWRRRPVWTGRPA